MPIQHQDRLTRLAPFPDPFRLRLEPPEQRGEQNQNQAQDQKCIRHTSTLGPAPPGTTTRDQQVGEAKSDASSTPANPSFYSESDPQRLPSPYDAISPSITSESRAARPVSNMVPGPSDPVNSKPGPSPPSPFGADAAMTTNMQWRPRSAPKSSHSRSASPLLFWNRKGNQQNQYQNEQQQQHPLPHPHPLQQQHHPQEQGPRGVDADWFAAEKRESHDAIDSVSNHLGKITPPPGSGLGTDRKDSTIGRGDSRLPTTPSITREEYEALPLAIQRKVRLLGISSLPPLHRGLKSQLLLSPEGLDKSTFSNVHFMFASPAS